MKISNKKPVWIHDNATALSAIEKMNSLKEKDSTDYTNLEDITKELDSAKKTFKKFNWPIIDVTRKSVEETAASIIKIYEITKKNA